jgi:hypothetical protein
MIKSKNILPRMYGRRFMMPVQEVMRQFVQYERERYNEERDAAENHDLATQWESPSVEEDHV